MVAVGSGESLSMCLESRKNGNDLIWKSNHLFGIGKKMRNELISKSQQFPSFIFEIPWFFMGFGWKWIDFNFEYLKRLFCPFIFHKPYSSSLLNLWRRKTLVLRPWEPLLHSSLSLSDLPLLIKICFTLSLGFQFI